MLNKRIENRVKHGDHYVRPDIVEERYINGLSLLNHYFKIPDRLQLFDNSTRSILMAEIEFGHIMVKAPFLPAWITQKLNKQFEQSKNEEVAVRDLQSIDAVRNLYLKNKSK